MVIRFLVVAVAVCLATGSQIDKEDVVLKVAAMTGQPGVTDATNSKHQSAKQYLVDLKASLEAESSNKSAAHQSKVLDGFCDRQGLEDELAALADQIRALNSTVNEKTAHMQAISRDEIPPLRTLVDAFHPDIMEAEQKLNDAQDASEARTADYKRQVLEIKQAMNDLEDIRTKLVDLAAGGNLNTKQIANFLELGARSERGLKAQLMRTAARAINSDVVDNIYEIIYRMRNEFKAQLDTMRANEEMAGTTAYDKKLTDRRNVGDLLVEMEKEKQKIVMKHKEMSEEEGLIAIANIDMAGKRKEYNNKQLEIENQEMLCEEYKTTFALEETRRNEAILKIQEIIDELPDDIASMDSSTFGQGLTKEVWSNLNEAEKLESGAGQALLDSVDDNQDHKLYDQVVLHADFSNEYQAGCDKANVDVGCKVPGVDGPGTGQCKAAYFASEGLCKVCHLQDRVVLPGESSSLGQINTLYYKETAETDGAVWCGE